MDNREGYKELNSIMQDLSREWKLSDRYPTDVIYDWHLAEVKKAKIETLEKVWSYTYNGLFLEEALNKIESEVKNNG